MYSLENGNFPIRLVIGGRDQESTGFAWWSGNARVWILFIKYFISVVCKKFIIF